VAGQKVVMSSEFDRRVTNESLKPGMPKITYDILFKQTIKNMATARNFEVISDKFRVVRICTNLLVFPNLYNNNNNNFFNMFTIATNNKRI
jgi:hypothetical protein